MNRHITREAEMLRTARMKLGYSQQQVATMAGMQIRQYSFSRAGGMEEDDISNYLRMPILLKSPSIIVDTVMWLDEIVNGVNPGESLNIAVVNALAKDEPEPTARDSPGDSAEKADAIPIDMKALTDAYEYAYWLGYIYRCECHMHDESSRMVYGAFNEAFMRSFYEKLAFDDDVALTECAPEICRRMDALLVGKLWRQKDG